MKKILFIILFIAAFSSVSLSQKKFYFYADYALFRNLDTKSTVEIYFSVNQRDLKYVKAENNYLGQANIEISIFDKGKNKLVFDDLFGLQSKVTDTNKRNLTNKLIGQQNFSLNNGNFIFKLVGSDNTTADKRDSVQFDINISEHDTLKTELSDIQIATGIEKSSNEKSIYYKNGMEVTPNPDALFGMNLKTIYFYLEIYSLKRNFSGDSIYLLTMVSDASENIIRQSNQSVNSKSDAFVEIGNINIDSLDKGAYTLKLKLLDNKTGQFLEKSKKFYIYNSSKNVTSNQLDEKGYLKSEYQTMTLDMINDEFDKTIYIRTTPEDNEFKKLKSLDEKRKFMYSFWNKRSFNPNSQLNLYKTNYFKRVTDANSLFKQGFMEGWKTDRGRVYITYGEPEDIDRHPSEADSKGYEVWTYETIQGGAVCAFAERELNSGIYYLVHSTIRGEYRDDGWKDKLKK